MYAGSCGSSLVISNASLGALICSQEKDVYAEVLSNARSAVIGQSLGAGGYVGTARQPAPTYAAILHMLLRLRRACNHPWLVGVGDCDRGPCVGSSVVGNRQGDAAPLVQNGSTGQTPSMQQPSTNGPLSEASARAARSLPLAELRRLVMVLEQHGLAASSAGPEGSPEGDAVAAGLCSACGEPPDSPVIVAGCGHVYCADCVYPRIEEAEEAAAVGDLDLPLPNAAGAAANPTSAAAKAGPAGMIARRRNSGGIRSDVQACGTAGGSQGRGQGTSGRGGAAVAPLATTASSNGAGFSCVGCLAAKRGRHHMANHCRMTDSVAPVRVTLVQRAAVFPERALRAALLEAAGGPGPDASHSAAAGGAVAQQGTQCQGPPYTSPPVGAASAPPSQKAVPCRYDWWVTRAFSCTICLNKKADCM
jgi:hypothetical protein